MPYRHRDRKAKCVPDGLPRRGGPHARPTEADPIFVPRTRCHWRRFRHASISSLAGDAVAVPVERGPVAGLSEVEGATLAARAAVQFA
jgi:hypothetical protein